MFKRLIIIFICILILLPSCETNHDRSYVSKEVTYSEPTAQYAFRVSMDYLETELAKYYFDEGIEHTDREACIQETEKILSNQNTESIIPEIYIFSQDRYNYKYITEHKLYSSIQNWESAEYITDVLLAYYGKSTNYGIAFGYANYLSQTDKQKTNLNGDFVNPSVRDILDLNYLCFDDNFAASNDISIAKDISCDFSLSYISRYGENSIQQLLSSSIEAQNALTTYYLDNGVSYKPSLISYGCGGKSYDYIVYSDYGTFYIENNWIDSNEKYNPLITDGFLHSNYTDTKTFFETNIKQMKQYQDLFNLDNYNNELGIVFQKVHNASKYSFYQNVDHRIYVYNVDSLMHEYIHALTQPIASMEQWKVEGFARYFSYYYDYYGVAFLNQDYNSTPNSPATKYVHEYLENIDRPIDIVIDYTELENIAVYSRSFTNPNSSYAAGSSFVQYLVKQYGENRVVDYIYGSGAVLPKTHVELVQEWISYINNNYSNYSKYK